MYARVGSAGSGKHVCGVTGVRHSGSSTQRPAAGRRTVCRSTRRCSAAAFEVPTKGRRGREGRFGQRKEGWRRIVFISSHRSYPPPHHQPSLTTHHQRRRPTRVLLTLSALHRVSRVVRCVLRYESITLVQSLPPAPPPPPSLHLLSMQASARRRVFKLYAFVYTHAYIRTAHAHTRTQNTAYSIRSGFGAPFRFVVRVAFRCFFQWLVSSFFFLRMSHRQFFTQYVFVRIYIYI